MTMHRFIDRWSEPHRWAYPVEWTTLEDIEAALGLQAPPDYAEAVKYCGIPRLSSGLAEAMRACQFHWELRELYSVDLLAPLTKELRSASLPLDLLAIGQGADDMVLCLRDFARDYPEDDDYEVLGYDRTNGTVWDISPSFGDLIGLLSDLGSRGLH